MWKLPEADFEINNMLESRHQDLVPYIDTHTSAIKASSFSRVSYKRYKDRLVTISPHHLIPANIHVVPISASPVNLLDTETPGIEELLWIMNYNVFLADPFA